MKKIELIIEKNDGLFWGLTMSFTIIEFFPLKTDVKKSISLLR